jgi:hypothetical protein
VIWDLDCLTHFTLCDLSNVLRFKQFVGYVCLQLTEWGRFSASAACSKTSRTAALLPALPTPQSVPSPAHVRTHTPARTRSPTDAAAAARRLPPPLPVWCPSLLSYAHFLFLCRFSPSGLPRFGSCVGKELPRGSSWCMYILSIYQPCSWCRLINVWGDFRTFVGNCLRISPTKSSYLGHIIWFRDCFVELSKENDNLQQSDPKSRY